MGAGEQAWAQETAWARPAFTPLYLVDNDIQRRRPLGQLFRPGHDGGERHDHQKGAVDVLDVKEVRQKDGALDGLAQAHLVGQNDARARAPRLGKPVEALQLVVAKHKARLGQAGRLLVHEKEADRRHRLSLVGKARVALAPEKIVNFLGEATRGAKARVRGRVQEASRRPATTTTGPVKQARA